MVELTNLQFASAVNTNRLHAYRSGKVYTINANLFITGGLTANTWHDIGTIKNVTISKEIPFFGVVQGSKTCTLGRIQTNGNIQIAPLVDYVTNDGLWFNVTFVSK